jgi:hypothetical protein
MVASAFAPYSQLSALAEAQAYLQQAQLALLSSASADGAAAAPASAGEAAGLTALTLQHVQQLAERSAAVSRRALGQLLTNDGAGAAGQPGGADLATALLTKLAAEQQMRLMQSQQQDLFLQRQLEEAVEACLPGPRPSYPRKASSLGGGGAWRAAACAART